MAGLNITIRPERVEDKDAIRIVLKAAFPTTAEADLVDLCRERGRLLLSLVGLDRSNLVGHILFTLVTLDPPFPGLRGVGIGPVAVLPAYQGKGIGSQLMTIGIEMCSAQGYDFAVLLGDPAYYTRFGFIPGREFGLSSDYGEGDAFQARELKPGALRGIKALIKYTPEFNETVG